MSPRPPTPPAVTSIDDFITRWQDVSGSERANYQMFLADLAKALELPSPDPAQDDTAENAYVFERRVDFFNGDGTQSRGFIDLYRRGAFVCEAKQTGAGLDTGSWD